MSAFIIWCLVDFVFIIIGFFMFFSKQTVSLWANVKSPEITDTEARKKHNRTTAKLWWIYSIVFLILGLPLLKGQNHPLIILSILGVVFETIILMAIYILFTSKNKI